MPTQGALLRQQVKPSPQPIASLESRLAPSRERAKLCPTPCPLSLQLSLDHVTEAQPRDKEAGGELTAEAVWSRLKPWRCFRVHSPVRWMWQSASLRAQVSNFLLTQVTLGLHFLTLGLHFRAPFQIHRAGDKRRRGFFPTFHSMFLLIPLNFR